MDAEFSVDSLKNIEPPPLQVSTGNAILNLIIQVVSVGVASYVAYHNFTSQEPLFSTHVTLMLIGYLVFLSQSIMTMSENNYLTNTFRSWYRVLYHWLMASATGVLALVAVVCMYRHKHLQSEKHFRTPHSWLGLPTICLTLFSMAAGTLLKVTLMTRVKKVVHSFLGILTYCLALMTIMVGIHSTIYDDNMIVATALIVVLLILIAYVLLKPIALAVSRLKDLLR